LGESLLCSCEPEEDESVYLALFGQDGIRIKRFGVFFQGGNNPSDFRREVSHHIVRKPPDARATGQEARPGRFDIGSKGRDRSHACNNNPSHLSSYQFGCAARAVHTAQAAAASRT
jgi:hypothetical protein